MNKIPASILEIAIREGLTNYEAKEESNSLSDLYLYHDTEDNSLVIYDDAEYELNKVRLPDDGSYNLIHTLRQVLQHEGKERLFDRRSIVKPFTVSLVDKDFVVLEELFFWDDDTIKIEDTLWKNIEKDLDSFFENLLK
jgi:peptidyl-tRNA hydrolase